MIDPPLHSTTYLNSAGIGCGEVNQNCSGGPNGYSQKMGLQEGPITNHTCVCMPKNDKDCWTDKILKF